MTTIGSYEAKTHLPQLLEQVMRGEKITITKRGKPIAMLVPIEVGEANIGSLVKEMLHARDSEGPKLGKSLTVGKLVDEGRRF